MKLANRLKRWFSRNIDDFFKTTRRIYVPVVQGGMWVDHDTAITLASVFGAVRYISESVASLPWNLRMHKNGGGSELANKNNVHRLIHTRPNPRMSSFDWRVLMLSRANLWGNAYAEIIRDRSKRPIALWPISPERVTPKVIEGILVYEVTQANSEKEFLFSDDMYHIRGIGDSLQGYSVVSLAARSIGQGLASDEFAGSFFKNGVISSGVYIHPKGLGDKAYERLKKEIQEKQAGPKNSWKPMLLEEGMKWEPVSMPLKDAQFLESRKFNVTEIARWFRVPPHKIADLERATFSNIEEQNIDVVQETIIPWAIRLEQEVDFKMISWASQNIYYSKINVSGMLRGDSVHRSQYYHMMRNMGAINADEIRELEDMNPIEGGAGKKYVMQGQYTTLDKVGEEPETPPPFNEEEEEGLNSISATWKTIIYDALLRAELRRKNRLENAKEHMTGENYKNWMVKFIKQQSQYSINTLRPSCIGFAQALGVIDFVGLETYLNTITTMNDRNINEDKTEDDLWSLVEDIQIKIISLRRS